LFSYSSNGVKTNYLELKYLTYSHAQFTVQLIDSFVIEDAYKDDI